MVTVQRRIIFPSCVKLLKEINCHGTIVGIYANSAFLSLSQYSLSIFGHHLLFLHRIGTEGSKGTSSVCPAWCGHRKFCRLPVLIFSFPLLTLLFPPSPTLLPPEALITPLGSAGRLLMVQKGGLGAEGLVGDGTHSRCPGLWALGVHPGLWPAGSGDEGALRGSHRGPGERGPGRSWERGTTGEVTVLVSVTLGRLSYH